MGPSIAVALGLFVLFSLLIVLLAAAHRQSEQNSVRRALIEKFGSAHDLAEFLQSEGGRRFLEDLSSDSGAAGGAVLGSVQRGVVLVLVGCGCCAGSFFLNSNAIMAVGIVVLFAGAGFLLSALVTHWLSRQPGMLKGRDNQ